MEITFSIIRHSESIEIYAYREKNRIVQTLILDEKTNEWERIEKNVVDTECSGFAIETHKGIKENCYSYASKDFSDFLLERYDLIMEKLNEKGNEERRLLRIEVD